MNNDSRGDRKSNKHRHYVINFSEKEKKNKLTKYTNRKV